MPPAAMDPSMHRRRLRAALRQVREEARMTQKDVAVAMDWHPSKLIRIEAGAVRITINDLKVLLAHYGVVDQERIGELVRTARSARERSWWEAHRHVASPQFIQFLGYESSAQIIRNYEPILVPGLLQTEAYARALFRITAPNADARRIDSLVDLRLERQEMLHRPDVEAHFIIDETVLRRSVGESSTMREQLERLLREAERPNVTIRIVPVSYGYYELCRTPYVIFEFEPEDGTILYIENPLGEMIFQEGTQRQIPR